MKTLTMVVCALILSGCAHAYIDSWRDKEITACGNKWADSNDIEAEARKSCGGKLVPVGGSSKIVGAKISEYGNVRTKENKCVTFRCD